MGNLLNRTLSMLVKYFDGEIKSEFVADSPLFADCKKTIEEVKHHFDYYEVAEAAQKIVELVDKTNKFVTDNAPWTLAKEEKMTECGQVLYTVLEVMCVVASLIYPYCPNIASKMAQQLSYDLSTKLDDIEIKNIKAGKLISKEEISPVFLRLDSELADKSKKV
jgi:methionyl-tRNA synthetase